MQFCCDQMEFHIQEKEQIISYIPRERLFGIKVNNTGTIQQIFFCPWCGTRLPKDLTDELDEIIFDELQLDDFKEDSRMPQEFKTDAWWKKRGL